MFVGMSTHMDFSSLLADPVVWVAAFAAYSTVIIITRLRNRRRSRSAPKRVLPHWAFVQYQRTLAGSPGSAHR
jgi:hypothetical protein